MTVGDFIPDDIMKDETIYGVEVVLYKGNADYTILSYIGNSETKHVLRWIPSMVVLVVCEVAL